MGFFIDHDRGDIGRRHRIDDELRRILVPQDDIDPLATEFVGHRLNARSTHADASAHRIDTLVVCAHRDLGAQSRVAGGTDDLDQALADLRHLELEQFDQQRRLGTRDEQLRTTLLGTHVIQIAAQPIAGARGLLRDDLALRHQRLGIVAQIQHDRSAVGTLDDAGDQLADAILVGLDDLRPLGLAHLLNDDLLGGLCRDTAKRNRLDLVFDIIAWLEVGVFGASGRQRDLADGVFEHLGLCVIDHQPAPERLVVARLAIDRHADLDLATVLLSSRRCQGRLDGLENDFFFDALLVGYRINHEQDFFVHRSAFRLKLGY